MKQPTTGKLRLFAAVAAGISACTAFGDVSPKSESGRDAAPAAKLPKLPPKATPGFAVLGNLGLVPSPNTKIVYGGWAAPNVNGGVSQHRLTIQLPVAKTKSDRVSLSFGGTALRFGEPKTLASSGTPVPRDLWKLEVGAGYSRRLDDGKFAGVRLSVGSASDRPFDGLNVTTIGASAYYSWTKSERTRWMISVFFSNNNPILNWIPIPGVTYLYQTDVFIGLFGFPFTMLVWRPVHPWSFTLSVFGPTIHSEIDYGNAKGVQLFAGYAWLQQSFLRKDRPDPKDRIYYDEMHAPVGVRFPVGRLRSEVSTGYAFRRSVYEGTKFGRKNGGRVDLDHDWYGAWNLGFVF
jgi:hypothetical protein